MKQRKDPDAIERFNVFGRVALRHNISDRPGNRLGRAEGPVEEDIFASRGSTALSRRRDDPEFRRIVNGAFLNMTDGMPLVWVGKRSVNGRVERIPGRDFMLDIFEATRGGEFTHFFYGGAPGVADALKRALEARCLGARVVGTFCPPFRPLMAQEEEALAATLRELRPDFLWIGFEHPKQERSWPSILESSM